MSRRSIRFVRPLAALFLLAVSAGAQTLVFTQDALNQVSSVPSGGGASGVVVTPGLGGLSSPFGVRRGPDNMLYVVSQGAQKVLRYHPDGTQDTTFVLPNAPFVTPFDVAFHPSSGRMYVSDYSAPCIFVFDLKANTLVTTITNALMLSPTFMNFTPSGQLYVSDTTTNSVLRINNNSTTPTTFVAPSAGGLSFATGVVFSGTRLYVGSWLTDQVLMYDQLGAFAGVEAALAFGSGPMGLAVDDTGKIHVACRIANQILRFDPNLGGNQFTTCVVAGPLSLDFERPPRARFPLRAGELVTTIGSENPVLANWTNPLGLVVKVIDARTGGPTGENWPAMTYSNEFPVTHNTWNETNLGQVFGLTLDDLAAPSIYVAASTSFGWTMPGPSGPGGVYKLDGCDGRIVPWMVTGTGAVGTNTLPNTGPALGNICYDAAHKQFFVSNFEDGKIYRVKSNGLQGKVTQVFDPFAADDGAQGFAPLGERVWAVHVSSYYDATKLFFSVWLRDELNTATPWPASWPAQGANPVNNAVFAVTLNATGAIVGAPTLWKVMPHLSLIDTFSNPVSDITSTPRILYFAERTMFGPIGTWPAPDRSRLMRMLFFAQSTLWKDVYKVGDGGSAGWNCAGGVAADPQWNLWTTGENLHDTGPGNYIDGLQKIRFTGNQNDTTYTLKSKLIDIDGWLLPWHRTVPGDVEYVRQDANAQNCPQTSGGGPGDG